MPQRFTNQRGADTRPFQYGSEGVPSNIGGNVYRKIQFLSDLFQPYIHFGNHLMHAVVLLRFRLVERGENRKQIRP